VYPIAYLFLSACSTLDPLAESPLVGDAASDDADVCSNTGIGAPEESASASEPAYPIESDWLVLGDYFQVTAECLATPPLQISSDSEGTWPITQLEFYVVGGPDDTWVTDVARDGLTLTLGSEEIGWYGPDDVSCDESQCEGHWKVDLAEADIAVSTEENMYMTINLDGLDDAAGVDELWDDAFDTLVLLSSLSGDYTDPSTGNATLYMAIAWTGMVIEPVDTN
jgi:hypothetical protein